MSIISCTIFARASTSAATSRLSASARGSGRAMAGAAAREARPPAGGCAPARTGASVASDINAMGAISERVKRMPSLDAEWDGPPPDGAGRGEYVARTNSLQRRCHTAANRTVNACIYKAAADDDGPCLNARPLATPAMPRHRWRLALYAAVLAALAATRATAQTTASTASTAAPGAPTASRRTTDGHAASVPVATAAERRGAITIDGRLDEAAWAAAEPITDFTQLDPDEGRPISERTEVRILFDGAALYIAARMWDQRGAAGVQTRLVRRDQQMDSDWFEVVIDSFHDHLGRAFFRVNPSGVKFDALGQGNSNPDAGWDPIWESATSVGIEGWTAEYRIPLSQLRFPRAERQAWRLQVRRFISRRNEYAQWSHWGKNDVGGPSRFGHLEGLHLSAQPRHAEVLPYVVAVSRHVQPEVRGDPFNDGSRQELRGGADLRYGVTT